MFLDIGLMTCAGKLSAEILINDDIVLADRGMLAEQFVGQELLAYASPFDESRLYFWSREQRSSMAEVDFVTTVDAKIIPIEVKAGTTGRLKSLHLFMEEKKSYCGIRLSQHTMSRMNAIISLPLYLSSEVSRIVRAV